MKALKRKDMTKQDEEWGIAIEAHAIDTGAAIKIRISDQTFD